MSNPVTTEKWAGQFDCSVCKRKRLVGSEFSKKALERYRKSGGALKCKSCTTAQEEQERLLAAEAAAAKKQTSDGTGRPSDRASISSEDHHHHRVTCSRCKKSLPATDFNRNQLAKKEKARCRTCVEKAIQEEEQSRSTVREMKIKELKEKLQAMNLKGDVKGKLQYESELSALEAEHVTGLKPILMGSSRRSRGRGNGRNQTAGGRIGRRNLATKPA